MSSQIQKRLSKDQQRCLKSIQSIKPTWTQDQQIELCAQNNWDLQKIEQAIALIFEDERPHHTSEYDEWSEVGKKTEDSHSAPVRGAPSTRGRGGRLGARARPSSRPVSSSKFPEDSTEEENKQVNTHKKEFKPRGDRVSAGGKGRSEKREENGHAKQNGKPKKEKQPSAPAAPPKPLWSQILGAKAVEATKAAEPKAAEKPAVQEAKEGTKTDVPKSAAPATDSSQTAAVATEGKVQQDPSKEPAGVWGKRLALGIKQLASVPKPAEDSAAPEAQNAADEAAAQAEAEAQRAADEEAAAAAQRAAEEAAAAQRRADEAAAAEAQRRAAAQAEAEAQRRAEEEAAAAQPQVIFPTGLGAAPTATVQFGYAPPPVHQPAATPAAPVQQPAPAVQPTQSAAQPAPSAMNVEAGFGQTMMPLNNMHLAAPVDASKDAPMQQPYGHYVYDYPGEDEASLMYRQGGYYDPSAFHDYDYRRGAMRGGPQRQQFARAPAKGQPGNYYGPMYGQYMNSPAGPSNPQAPKRNGSPSSGSLDSQQPVPAFGLGSSQTYSQAVPQQARVGSTQGPSKTPEDAKNQQQQPLGANNSLNNAGRSAGFYGSQQMPQGQNQNQGYKTSKPYQNNYQAGAPGVSATNPKPNKGGYNQAGYAPYMGFPNMNYMPMYYQPQFPPYRPYFDNQYTGGNFDDNRYGMDMYQQDSVSGQQSQQTQQQQQPAQPKSDLGSQMPGSYDWTKDKSDKGLDKSMQPQQQGYGNTQGMRPGAKEQVPGAFPGNFAAYPYPPMFPNGGHWQ